MIWGQKMDKNEKLWFSTKKRPSYHNILWSEDFKDTRCCGKQANKICLLFGDVSDDEYRKVLDAQDDWRHA